MAATQNIFLSASAPLRLTTDASDVAIGATLEQYEGDWRPIGFFSRKLSPTEQNYSTYDRELLAIYAAIKFFRHILEGRHFITRTDHRPLVFAFRQRSNRVSPRQLRQLNFISQFNTTIEHLRGEDNPVADALSRMNAVPMPSILNAEMIQKAQQQEDVEDIRQLADTSLSLQPLIIEGRSILCHISSGYVRPYPPKQLRKQTFDIVHGLFHPSGRVTQQGLREKFI